MMAVNKFLLTFIAGQMKGTGLALQGMDENTTGKDDLAGVLLDAGSDVLANFSGSNTNESKVRRAVQAIRDSCDTYLKATQT